jgi:hemolysin activation/secretion protein
MSIASRHCGTLRSRSIRCASRLVLGATAATLLVASAQAQYVERNLPPAPPEGGGTIRLGIEDLRKPADDTPLGVNLRAIVLLAAKDKVARRKAQGIEVDRIAGIDAAAVRARLAPFTGRPLTRKVIADAQAEVAAVYREAGRPFTRGVLQLRVIPFRLGAVKVAGAVATPESYIRERVRVTPGEPIEARRLETDLDWLNRNPFRQVEAVFGPGKDLALTDLTLQTTERKPWQVFGGYANSGTLLTDRDRFFLGATVANIPYTDVIASYQATGSKDFWGSDGLFGDVETAKYMSHSGRLIVPLWPRSSLEIVGDFVQTNETNDPFRVKTQTSEVSAIYRTAVSNLLPIELGDWLAGIELKHEHRVTFFNEVDTGTHGNADVAQFVVGWNGRWTDRYGSNNLDVRLKANPGDVLPYNNAVDWSLFTNGRVTSVHTAFATMDYARTTPLFMGLSLLTEVSALLADQALPDTERLALGGAQAVRGYVVEDGVFDTAVTLRNTLYFPALRRPLGLPGFDAAVVPFVFGDAGRGRDIFLGHDTTLASTGGGFDFLVGSYLKSNLTFAYALRDGLYTQEGDWRIHARVTVIY